MSTKKLKKAETEAQRKRRGAANPERTQEARDRMAFTRYARKHPAEARIIALQIAGLAGPIEEIA